MYAIQSMRWSFRVLNGIKIHAALCRYVVRCGAASADGQPDTGHRKCFASDCHVCQAAIHQEPSDRRGEEGCTKGTDRVDFRGQRTSVGESKPVETCRNGRRSTDEIARPRRRTTPQCRETLWVTPSRTVIHTRCCVVIQSIQSPVNVPMR